MKTNGNTTIYLTCMVLLCIIFNSCIHKTSSSEDYVTRWVGKQIVLSQMEEYNIINNISTNLNNTYKYTIINYVSNKGCLDCKLQLAKWKSYIYSEELNKRKIRVLFIFPEDKRKRIKGLLHKENFTESVFFDSNSLFKKNNGIEDEMKMQTFLLNESMIVLAVGNPILNPQIRTLFNKIVDKGEKEKKTSNTNIYQSTDKINFGTIPLGKKVSKTIILKNMSKDTISIKRYGVSCSCIEFKCKNIILPGEEIKATISYTPKHVTPFFETVYIESNALPEIKPIELTGEISPYYKP